MKTSQPYVEPEMRSTLTACKQRLVDHYGKKMKSLILYGSAAKQQLTPDSDIDLLVLLEPPLDYFKELRMIVDLLYPLQLESSHWLSVKPAATNQYESQLTQLYRNIQKEGIVL